MNTFFIFVFVVWGFQSKFPQSSASSINSSLSKASPSNTNLSSIFTLPLFISCSSSAPAPAMAPCKAKEYSGLEVAVTAKVPKLLIHSCNSPRPRSGTPSYLPPGSKSGIWIYQGLGGWVRLTSRFRRARSVTSSSASSLGSRRPHPLEAVRLPPAALPPSCCAWTNAFGWGVCQASCKRARLQHRNWYWKRYAQQTAACF